MCSALREELDEQHKKRLESFEIKMKPIIIKDGPSRKVMAFASVVCISLNTPYDIKTVNNAKSRFVHVLSLLISTNKDMATEEQWSRYSVTTVKFFIGVPNDTKLVNQRIFSKYHVKKTYYN